MTLDIEAQQDDPHQQAALRSIVVTRENFAELVQNLSRSIQILQSFTLSDTENDLQPDREVQIADTSHGRSGDEQIEATKDPRVVSADLVEKFYKDMRDLFFCKRLVLQVAVHLVELVHRRLTLLTAYFRSYPDIQECLPR